MGESFIFDSDPEECGECGWQVSTTLGEAEARSRVAEHIEQEHEANHE
jgi:predicted small metal-binding protein